MAKILVIGSANADLMLAVPKLPRPGETVRGRDFVVVPGGKGANQAVAAARLGGDVSFVGCIGDDDFGKNLRASLADSGVDVTHLLVKAGVASGIAMVMTEASGENSIAISGGANDLLRPDDVDALTPLFAAVALVVCQFETPAATVERVVTLANSNGVPVLLNPAPARPVADRLLDGLQFLVPNRYELAGMTGIATDDPDGIAAAAKSLLDRGVRAVIVTLGQDGVALVDRSGMRLSPAVAVDAVDTTGAGDAFVGAFAAHWCRTTDVEAAIAFAQRAAARSVTRRGAQAAMPWLAEME
jgi:ribokinase